MYDSTYYIKRKNSSAGKAEIKEIISLLNPQKMDKILEVGCGGGILLKQLERYKCILVGVDSSTEAVRIAQKNVFYGRIVLGNAQKLDFDDNSFDKIVCRHLIEHFDDDISFLKELNRVLKVGGIIVIATPNINYPNHGLFYDPDHKHIYSINELKKILDECGFIILKAYSLMPKLMVTLFKKEYNLGVKFWKLFKLTGIHPQKGQTIFIKAKRR